MSLRRRDMSLVIRLDSLFIAARNRSVNVEAISQGTYRFQSKAKIESTACWVVCRSASTRTFSCRRSVPIVSNIQIDRIALASCSRP